MSEKVNILGVRVDMVNISRSADKICEFLNDEKLSKVYTPNSEIIMAAYKDESFRQVLNRAELLTADGIGVVYASKIVGKPIGERAAGYDIACEVLKRISTTSYSVYLLGGKPGVAQTAKENLLKTYPNLKIAGLRDGYFKPEEEDGVIEEINKSEADIVFVCLGAPKQELFIQAHMHEMNAYVFAGLGGSLDVFAGTAKRAPEFFVKFGLEWLYRLIKQPSRIKRMSVLPLYVIESIKYRLGGKK